MDMNIIIESVSQYGYLALFFLLWLGIAGLPVPDEGVVMGGGMIAAMGMLAPLPVFCITYGGVISGLTLGYVIGRWAGRSALAHWRKKQKLAHYVGQTEHLMERFGRHVLIVSYFIPVVRHLVPYWVGAAGMSYGCYARLSYSTGLIWTFVYFFIGYCCGQYRESILIFLEAYRFWVVLLTCGGMVLWGTSRFCQILWPHD